MWSVEFRDANGAENRTECPDFETANNMAKQLRSLSHQVRLKKHGSGPRRWHVYLFQPGGDPSLVGEGLSTRAAMMAWVRWDHRGHGAVLVQWPVDVPVPATWGVSS